MTNGYLVGMLYISVQAAIFGFNLTKDVSWTKRK